MRTETLDCSNIVQLLRNQTAEVVRYHAMRNQHVVHPQAEDLGLEKQNLQII